jgi:GTP cyclohydrolase IA
MTALRPWRGPSYRPCGKTPAWVGAKAAVTQTLTHLPVSTGRDRGDVDLPAAQKAAHDLLDALGVDLTDESVRDTPRRMASMYAELLTPASFTPTTFPNDGGYDELVVATGIPFHSMCEHHLLPFVGVAHVGYVPGDRILGLSKLARAVELFAFGLQIQERLTVQVATWLEEQLSPRGVGVVLDAEHMCMSLRGVEKPGARTLTSSLSGCIRDDPRTRQEFLALAGVHPVPTGGSGEEGEAEPCD